MQWSDPITWNGYEITDDVDLEARWNLMLAQVENVECREICCRVMRYPDLQSLADGTQGEVLFQSLDSGLSFSTAAAAKWFCELVMRASIAGTYVLPQDDAATT
jgi:hypothetical protein